MELPCRAQHACSVWQLSNSVLAGLTKECMDNTRQAEGPQGRAGARGEPDRIADLHNLSAARCLPVSLSQSSLQLQLLSTPDAA